MGTNFPSLSQGLSAPPPQPLLGQPQQALGQPEQALGQPQQNLGVQPGPQIPVGQLQELAQMLMGLLQPPEAKKDEPTIFDTARALNSGQEFKLNPIGKETLKKKTDNYEGYWEALGYMEE